MLWLVGALWEAGVEKSLMDVAVAASWEEAAISEDTLKTVVTIEPVVFPGRTPPPTPPPDTVEMALGLPPENPPLGSPPGVTPIEPAPVEDGALPGPVLGLLGLGPEVEPEGETLAGTVTVALAELGPLEEPVAVTLVLADVAPGTKTVWLLLAVPVGEVTLTVLLPPAPLELAKTVELP